MGTSKFNDTQRGLINPSELGRQFEKFRYET